MDTDVIDSVKKSMQLIEAVILEVKKQLNHEQKKDDELKKILTETRNSYFSIVKLIT